MESVSPEFIAIISVGVALLGAVLGLARQQLAMLRHFHDDMGRRINETNDRMEKRFAETDKRIGRMEESLTDIRERLGWIEGNLNKHREPARDAVAAG